jgi:putative membrane protein
MVRDSASSCLPFSAVGGFVLGARAITLNGVARSVATLSTIVDLTAEFVAEIAFAAAGGVVLLAESTDSAIVVPTEIGLGLAIVIGIATIRLQRGMAPLFVRLGRPILGRWIDDKDGGAKISQADLAAMYGNSGRLALSTAIHLIGWVGKGLGNWIGFRLLGGHIGVIDGMAIEGLLHVMLAAAILVPGYAGVQEAGYVGLGALFGVPPEISLGVSLLRRARDIAIGIPILLFWQLIEVRRLRVD